jgi:hypothetical protein
MKRRRQSRGRPVVPRRVAEALEPRLMMTANPFTPGDLVVYRVGTGVSTTGSSTAVFLDEYTPGGTLVQSIALPMSGPVELTATGTSTTEGQLTLSPDGSTIAVTGYDVPPANATQTATSNGTVALVGASAGPTYYVLPASSVINGNNIRTAVVDGNKLYISGAATYVQYAAISSLTAGGAVNAATTPVESAAKNIQELQVFNGQLYFSTQKQSGYGISNDSVGSLTGEPTSSTGISGVADTSTNTGSFFFEHVGTGSGAPDSLYVADNSAGIEKYSLVGGSWVVRGTIGISGGVNGITGSVDGSGYVHIAATNSTGIYTITDESGQAGTIGGSATKIVSAVTNTLIEGVVDAPDDGVGSITGLGGTVGYTQGMSTINPAGAAGFSDASNLDGGSLVVSGGMAGDTIGITTGAGVTTSRNAVSCGGSQIGTFSGGNGTAALTVTFNAVGGAAVIAAAVQSLIRQIAFGSTTSSTVGSRSLSFQVTENSGASDKAVVETVTVAAPAATVPSINPLGTLNTGSNPGQQTIDLSGIAHNGGTGAITITAMSDNPAVVPNTGIGALAVNYTSPNSTGTITFTPPAGVSGLAHVAVTVTDGAGSSVTTETVNVIGPPVVTLPATAAAVENNPVAFSIANGNAISVADFAVGTGSVQATLSVGHGTLVLNGITGLSFTVGGNGQPSFTVTGTLASLDSALNGLVYTPTAGYTGADSLQLVASDLGNTALGTVQTLSSTLDLTVAAPLPVLLNEIEANEPGTADNRYQYVELSGTPGAVLNNVWFVTFDGSAGSAGTADLVVNLTGDAIGSDGLLVIQSSATAGHTLPTATTLVTDAAFFTVTGGFPNSTLSFFLFDSPDAGFVAGTDYDTDDNGTLDHLPAGAVPLDDVAIPDTNDPSDIIYGGVEVIENPALNKGTADAVTRFTGNSSTANAAWYGGELNDTGNVDSTIEYDPTRESVNEPAGAFLTPGSINYPPPPAFRATSYSFGVQLPASAGTSVGTVSATTIGSDTISYVLTGTGSANFALGVGSGAIVVAGGASLSVGTYTLTATATDNQTGVTSTAPVRVTVTGTPLNLAGPAFYLRLDGDGQHLDIWTNTSGTGAYNRQVLLGTVQNIAVQGTTGTDSVVVDFSAGDPLPAAGLTDTGGGNGTADTLLVIGSAGSDTVVSSTGQIVVNGTPINESSVGRTTFTPGGGIDSLRVTSGTLILAPPAGATGIMAMTFSAINISAGATLAMAAPFTAATRSVLVTSGLTLPASGGILDLSGNDLVVRGGSLSAIRNEIASGFDLAAGGDWSGAGIVSSAAADDGTHLTTLGVIQNSINGTAIYSTDNTLGGFDGVNTVATDVLVKYTFFGDANLNGVVDGSDYSLIDAGYASLGTLTGWSAGDFNYDGVIDGTDYTLIDNTFNSQQAATAVGPSVVVAGAQIAESGGGKLIGRAGNGSIDDVFLVRGFVPANFLGVSAPSGGISDQDFRHRRRSLGDSKQPAESLSDASNYAADVGRLPDRPN